MKLLFDESVPRPFGAYFPPSFEIRTVQRMGWSGRSNGDLLRLAASHEFDGFVTADRGIEYQQNLENRKHPVSTAGREARARRSGRLGKTAWG